MFKNILFFLSLLCTTCNALSADISTAPLLKRKQAPATIQEGVILPIPHDALVKFKLGYSLVTAEGSIFEWIPRDEEIENWSELIQIQSFVFPKKESAEKFASNFLNALKQGFPEVKIAIVKHSEDSVLLEWSLPKPANGQVAQNELVNIISTPKGIYRIAYTMKIPAIDTQTKNMWLKRLSGASIVPMERAPVSKTVYVPK